MNPGDIVLIRFPQADLQIGKLRPALIVARAPGAYPDSLLALITWRTYQAVPGFDEIIDPLDTDYPITGLKVRLVIRLARLVSVDPTIINARLGTISRPRLVQIRARLVNWLKAF